MAGESRNAISAKDIFSRRGAILPVDRVAFVASRADEIGTTLGVSRKENPDDQQYSGVRSEEGAEILLFLADEREGEKNRHRKVVTRERSAKG
jgi:hypothetical protein